MRQGNRFIVAAAVALMASALIACQPTQSPTPSPTSLGSAAPSVAPASAAPTQASGLPDPALSNVKTEVPAARGALVTPAGGTITATGTNGAVYTLALPAGALAESRQIDLYPVASLSDLPSGASMIAGVQFTPDGLHLLAPATLTITLPSAVDPAMTGIAWRGDGTAIRRTPVTADGQVVTLAVDHFSGAGVWLPAPAFAAALGCAQTDYFCLTDQARDSFATQRRTAANLAAFLRAWYHDIIDPFLQAEQRTIADDATSPSPDLANLTEDDAELTDINGAWYAAVDTAKVWLRSSTFTVAPEVHASRVLLVGTLRKLVVGFNGACATSGDNTNRAVEAANLGVSLHFAAERWGIATRANALDYLTLLLQSCAQVFFDPAPTYTGDEPGDSGSVEVQAGFTINGTRHIGPGLQVEAGVSGSNDSVVGMASDIGHYSEVIPWPAGVGSLKLNILATLQYQDALGTVQTEIFNAASITKDAEDLFRSTFDVGFDGWAHDHISCRTCQVDHDNAGGGVIHLDGRGRTSSGNAWMFRSFALPPSAKHLLFDVSAEVIAGSSSVVEVWVVDAGGKKTLLLPPTAVHNNRFRLSFVHKRLDLSRWAGQQVTIFIAQAYNHIGNFDKEIYIDNVRITAY